MLITAAILTTYTNPYLYGIQDIDITFRFPVIFCTMFGEHVRMHGHLR